MKPVFVRPEGGDSVKRVTCYVCGCPRCAEYPLAVRQQASGPYFPFLETHEPPDSSEPPSPDGRVLSCFLCYSYLTQQWQLYERDKVPPVKRIYWLKRVDNGPFTGVEVGVQSEYASQLLGLAPDPPLAPTAAPPPALEVKRQGPSGGTRIHQSPHPPAAVAPPAASVEVKRPRVNPPQPQPPSMPLPPPGVPPLPLSLTVPQISTQQEALDLSVESRRGVKREREDEQIRDKPGLVVKTEVLDLRMPDKNATTEVCYVCGDQHKKGTLSDIYAKQQSGSCPFFPSLVLHPRPSKSHPMESSGRVQGCQDCVRHLQAQWDTYEARKIALDERHYSLRRRLVKDSTRFVCYKCGREYPSSALCLLYCRPNSEKEPYYPFIEKLEPPEGASPISPQGMVQVCSVCSHSIPLQELKDSSTKSPETRVGGGGVESSGGTGGSEQQTTSTSAPTGLTAQALVSRPSSTSAVVRDTDPQLEEATCYLCHQTHARQVMHWLSMVADSATQDGTSMYFSFLKYLPRIGQNSVVENGRVLACSLCHHHLMTQWAEYEKEKVPSEHRQFSLRLMPINSPSPRLTPGPSISSPGMSPRADASPPHCFSSAVEAHLKSTSSEKKKPGGYSGQPLHTLEVSVSEYEPGSPVLPVITTQKALNVAVNCFVCSFHSKPGQTYTLRSKPACAEPFFPFLAKHQSAHPEARVDESCVLTCHCCFHSLILQWQRYEREKVDHYARLYDTYNYNCFICSLKTYRKRLYNLPVKDYPFLKDHNRPTGGMVVDGGHSVVVCKDCYSSLKNQYLELERWGVPVEKRQYNWIQRPPPPEFQQDSHSKSIQVFPSGTQPPGPELGSSSPGSHPGTPPGVLTQPGSGGSPRESHGPGPLGSTSAGGESGVQPAGVRASDASATSALTKPTTQPTPQTVKTTPTPIPSQPLKTTAQPLQTTPSQPLKTTAQPLQTTPSQPLKTTAQPSQPLKTTAQPLKITTTTLPHLASTDPAAPDTSAGNSITTPSCYAPLQLQSGIARQGGKHPGGLLTVAPGEDLNSGGTKRPTHTEQPHHLPKRAAPSKQPPHLPKRAAPSEQLPLLSKRSTNSEHPPHHLKRQLSSEHQPLHHPKRLTHSEHPNHPRIEHVDHPSPPPNNISFHPPSGQTTTLPQLEDNSNSQVIHKKRKSVIRAMSNNSVPTSNNSSIPSTTTTTPHSCPQLMPTSPELQAKCS